MGGGVVSDVVFHDGLAERDARAVFSLDAEQVGEVLSDFGLGEAGICHVMGFDQNRRSADRDRKARFMRKGKGGEM